MTALPPIHETQRPASIAELIRTSIDEKNRFGFGGTAFVYRLSDPAFKDYLLKVDRHWLDIARNPVTMEIESVALKEWTDSHLLKLTTSLHSFHGTNIGQYLLSNESNLEIERGRLAIIPRVAGEKLDLILASRLPDKTALIKRIARHPDSLTDFMTLVARIGSQDDYIDAFMFPNNNTKLDFMGDNIMIDPEGRLSLIDQEPTRFTLYHDVGTRTPIMREKSAALAVDAAANKLLFYLGDEGGDVKPDGNHVTQEYLSTLETFKTALDQAKAHALESFDNPDVARRMPGFRKVEQVSLSVAEPSHALKTMLDRLRTEITKAR